MSQRYIKININLYVLTHDTVASSCCPESRDLTILSANRACREEIKVCKSCLPEDLSQTVSKTARISMSAFCNKSSSFFSINLRNSLNVPMGMLMPDLTTLERNDKALERP